MRKIQYINKEPVFNRPLKFILNSAIILIKRHQEKAIESELLQESQFRKKESITAPYHQMAKRNFIISQANRHHQPKQSDLVFL